MTAEAKARQPDTKGKVTKMNGSAPMPPWLQQIVKGGGWAAGLALFYVAVLVPLREDFRDFKTTTTTGINTLRVELKDLSKAITGDLRDRLASANQRITMLEERCRSLGDRLDKVEKR